MWLLITYIIILSIAPGPVFIKTVQEARRNGANAGMLVALGASIMAIVIVLAAMAIHSLGFSAVLDSSSMSIIEQIGAVGIILIGAYAGYKCLTASFEEADAPENAAGTKTRLLQGMGMMVPTIPHGLLFYNVILPQTVGIDALPSLMIWIGALEVAMLFGYHALVAFIADRSNKMVRNTRYKKVFDFSLAALLIGMGVNILL